MFETIHQRLALFFVTVVFLCVAATYPVYPVDETRYLTVAWEMRHGHWVLPLLNGLPYSQKPPLLFWLINLAWTATGPCAWAARLVCFAFAVAVLALTRLLARALFPDRPAIYTLAPLLTACSPLFLVFSNMIMFDQLLFAFVLAGLYYLWRAGQARTLRPWLMLGLMMGIGALAKGPVILVNMLPPIVLAPFLWLPENSGYTRKTWYSFALLAIATGTAVGLAWAIPAAVIGGPTYTHMIFWGQSAGRMVGSFAHAAPFWFYVPFALLYIAPWLFLAPLWRSVRLANWRASPQVRFLLSWIVPAFVVMSCISGKQMHYILPLVSGAAILAAYGLTQALEAKPEQKLRPWFFLPYAVGLIGMAALPFLPFVRDNHKYQNLSHGVAYFESWPFLLGVLVAGGFVWLTRKRLEGQALAMVFCGCLAFCITTIEGGLHLYKFFDLTPLRPVLQPYNGHPVAFVGPYEGEVTFLARLDQPLILLRKDANPAQWLAQHPDGAVVLKNRYSDPLPAAKQIFEQPFHGDLRFSVLVPETARP